MPRVNLGQDMTIVAATIDKYVRLRGIKSIADLAPAAGFKSSKAMYNRMKHPEDFRLKELDGIYKKLRVPQEERVCL